MVSWSPSWPPNETGTAAVVVVTSWAARASAKPGTEKTVDLLTDIVQSVTFAES